MGKVLSIEKHPDADKLVVCQIDVGDKQAADRHRRQQPDRRRCGAHLRSTALICPAAWSSKKRKMRGVESNGMLCSFAELGLTLHDLPYADPRRHSGVLKTKAKKRCWASL